MNPAVFGSPPSDACTLGTAGSYGPDRIAQAVYDNADHVTQLKVAVGTSDAATERTLTYSNNGVANSLLDGENNLTTYEYDGFDRPSKLRFPSTAKGAGTSSTTDYEQPGYDSNSNVTSFRNRAGSNIGFTYDALDRATLKDLPGAEPDVAYTYDLLNRLTAISQTGNALSFTYDALGRQLTETGPQGTATSAWDLAGRRTQLTYPGAGLYVNTDYLVTGEATAIRENGATSGVGVLATYAYDNLGRSTSVTFGNAASQVFTYDSVSRLATLSNDLSGTTNDLSVTFSYNPASQIIQTVRTGDAYAWTGHGNGSTGYTTNGLNQLTAVGSGTPTYDANGNLTFEPQSGKTYGYSSENLLTSASGGVTLGFDPGTRLYQVAGAATTRFAYDGVNAIADSDGSNAIQHRYVFAPGVDQPILQYDGSGTTTRKFLSSDERGSIVSATDSSGTLIGINAYDEYGKPGASNIGRFQYTGQMWLSEAGVYNYKARNYAPQIGRFLQADPIGTDGGINLYAYTGNDPINATDPLGLLSKCGAPCVVHDPQFAPFAAVTEIVVTGQLIRRNVEAALRRQFESLDRQLGGGRIGGADGGGPGHRYSVKTTVCARALSPQEMKGLLSKFAVPGHGGETVTGGGKNYWAWGGPIPGRVSVTFSRGGLRVTNVTIPGEHPFSGQVQRDISVDNSATVITTYGRGNAQADGWDAVGMLKDDINQIAGPNIFGALDSKAATYAKTHFQGC